MVEVSACLLSIKQVGRYFEQTLQFVVGTQTTVIVHQEITLRAFFIKSTFEHTYLPI